MVVWGVWQSCCRAHLWGGLLESVRTTMVPPPSITLFRVRVADIVILKVLMADAADADLVAFEHARGLDRVVDYLIDLAVEAE